MNSFDERSIVWEDEHFLVVNKSAGVLVFADAGKPSLTTAVEDYLRRKDAGGPGADPCHRLDRETSGLLLLARGKAMQKKGMELFQGSKVTKTYLALTLGFPGKARGTCSLAIEGKPAATEWQLLSHGANTALLQCSPLTGRTNQIRIHCASMGYPILGDAKFGERKAWPIACKRTMLHAWKLQFSHPLSSKKIALVAPIPGDMEECMKSLDIELPESTNQDPAKY